MKVRVNGQDRDVPEGLTLKELLVFLGQDSERGGVAVAVNLDLVPLQEQGERPISEGDRVDVVTAVGGG